MAETAYLKSRKVGSEQARTKVTTYDTIADEHDAGLGGMLTLSVAGAANVTLTRDQALNAALKFTGALTASITVFIPVIANAAITPPTTTIGALRDYTVWNATTGAFSLTVKTSAVGSAGAAVTQGTRSLLTHDGTNVSAVVSGGGGSGDALVANPLSQFAATTSAQLAGVISDQTGTGLLVFGTSPTITTPLISGAATFPDNVRQTFNPGATVAGLNVGSQAGDPSTPTNGDIWYDSTANTLDARINGATVNLGAGGGGSGDVTAAANFATDNVIIRADGTGKGVQLSAVSISDTSGNVSTPGTVTTGSGGGASGNLALSGSTSGTANLTVPAAAGTGTFNLPVTSGGTYSLGYLDVPVNSQSAAYGFVLEDRGRVVYHPVSDTSARLWTIPANSSVAFPIGSCITIINDTGAGVITLAITTDVLVWIGTGGTGSRTIASSAIATILKVTSTRWVVNGVNVS